MSLKPVTYGMVYQGRRQKKNYPAVKIRVDIFKDDPGNFFPVGKNFPGSSSKKPTRIFTAGQFFFDGGCYDEDLSFANKD